MKCKNCNGTGKTKSYSKENNQSTEGLVKINFLKSRNTIKL